MGKPHTNLKRMRKKADELWSLAIRRDWNETCAVCGRRGGALHAHHLIPRQHYGTRFDMNNGICLCARCHSFCPKHSPHQNANGWMEWLRAHLPDTAIWYNANDSEKWSDNVTKNAQYYHEVLRDLRQYVEPYEFESIVGIQLATWLEENE